MKQLLFYDIDGTLLSQTTHSIPQSAIDAIVKAQSLGHETYFCTGRSFEMCYDLSSMGIDSAIICNGAGIVRHKQLIYSHAIDDDVMIKTIRQIKKLGGTFAVLDWQYNFQDDIFYQQFSALFESLMPERNIDEVISEKGIRNYEEYQGTPVLKIDYAFPSRRQAEEFLSHLDPSLDHIGILSYFVDPESVYGEIMCRDVNKGNGIRKLTHLMGLSLENTVGFGDSVNDIEMLQTCHESVVMGNAEEAIKEQATFVTRSVDDDGIAYAMTALHII